MAIKLTVDDLEEIEEWKEGQQYKLDLTVTQISDTKDGSARFAIDSVQGRPADSEGESTGPDNPAGSKATDSFKSALRKQVEKDKNGGKPRGY